MNIHQQQHQSCWKDSVLAKCCTQMISMLISCVDPQRWSFLMRLCNSKQTPFIHTRTYSRLLFRWIFFVWIVSNGNGNNWHINSSTVFMKLKTFWLKSIKFESGIHSKWNICVYLFLYRLFIKYTYKIGQCFQKKKMSRCCPLQHLASVLSVHRIFTWIYNEIRHAT